MADLVRRWLVILPPKKSPIAEAGLLWNKPLDRASKPKMDAFDLAVGVPGTEFLPVLNWKNPNW